MRRCLPSECRPHGNVGRNIRGRKVWLSRVNPASLVVGVQLILQSGFALFLRVQPHNVMQVSNERSVQEIVR